ncbi:hypothetical protein RRG08_042487 [Elysia crispata]|uniref:HTH psq-type domain-containing protein n=1 Tax=Elysia crispata TaxID=231223 RepID=A0AAE0YCT5_9GAST|nr:hypothetical protein RRG08_042487 [Elysia crispata]
MLIIYVDTDLSTSVPLTDEEIVVSVQPTTGTGNASNHDEEEATCLPTPTNQCNTSLKMPKRYTEKDISAALQAISDGMIDRDASDKFKIPTTTLCDYKKNRSTIGVKAGRKTSIPDEVEKTIIDGVLTSARAGFPMTKTQVLNKVGQVVQLLKLSTQFKGGIPGDRYWRCLKTRFPQLSVRSPECCSHSRLKCLSQERVKNNFTDLHNLMASEKIQPNAIWMKLAFNTSRPKLCRKKGSGPFMQGLVTPKKRSLLLLQSVL